MTAADLSAIARQRAFEAEQRRTGSLRKAIPGFYWITFLQLATCVAVAAFVIGAAVTWGMGG